MTYEILTITNPEVDEKGQKDLSKKIQDLVKKENGQAISEANLGTKKLATPAEDQETGTYLSIIAQLKPDSIKGIKKSLKSTAEIINVYIFKIAEKKVDKLSARPPARQEAKSALGGVKKVKKKAPVKKKVEKVPKVDKIAGTEKIKPKTEIKPKLKKVKPEAKSEITTEIEGEEDRLKKLDDKLDEILKE
jgi:ribosomal protein S6